MARPELQLFPRGTLLASDQDTSLRSGSGRAPPMSAAIVSARRSPRSTRASRSARRAEVRHTAAGSCIDSASRRPILYTSPNAMESMLHGPRAGTDFIPNLARGPCSIDSVGLTRSLGPCFWGISIPHQPPRRHPIRVLPSLQSPVPGFSDDSGACRCSPPFPQLLDSHRLATAVCGSERTSDPNRLRPRSNPHQRLPSHCAHELSTSTPSDDSSHPLGITSPA